MTDTINLVDFIPGTKAKAQEVNANFVTLKEAILTKAPNGGDPAIPLDVADATKNSHAINKGQFDSLKGDLIAVSQAKGVNFCIKSGNITNDKPDILAVGTGSSTQISFKVSDGLETNYKPLVISNAKGLTKELKTLESIDITPTNIENVFPILTSNTGQGYTLTASTEGEAAYLCADENAITRWRATTSSGWLKIHKNSGDFGLIYAYRIQGNYEPNLVTRSPKSWVVKDALGNIIDKRTNETGWKTSEVRTYVLAKPIKTNEIIFDTITNNGADYLTINGVEILSKTEVGEVCPLEVLNVFVPVEEKEAYTLGNTIFIQKEEPATKQIDDIWFDTKYEPVPAKKYTTEGWVDFEDVPIGQAVAEDGIITAVSTFDFNQNGYNLTRNNKDIFETWKKAYPDYKSGIAKTYSTTYTAEKDGWLRFYGSVGANQHSYLYINDLEVAHYSGNTNVLIYFSSIFPIGAGSKYQYNRTSSDNCQTFATYYLAKGEL